MVRGKKFPEKRSPIKKSSKKRSLLKECPEYLPRGKLNNFFISIDWSHPTTQHTPTNRCSTFTPRFQIPQTVGNAPPGTIFFGIFFFTETFYPETFRGLFVEIFFPGDFSSRDLFSRGRFFQELFIRGLVSRGLFFRDSNKSNQ